MAASMVAAVMSGVYQAEPVVRQIARWSLMHGWVPVTVQVMAVVVLACAIGWRSARWLRYRLPVTAFVAVLLVVGAHWYFDWAGVSDYPAPWMLWMWIGLSGLAAGMVVVGWAGARWWRRGLSVLAVTLSLLSAALVLNGWVGYFPTVYAAWNQLTAGPLPDQTDQAGIATTQLKGVAPATGAVVAVTIGAEASKFAHRGELVYLPPAWFASVPAPQLPAVMMIGGEFNTPADWLRAGDAIRAIDDFAAAHRGNAPLLVFVDSGGGFNVDTECVNGPRGNAADHLIKDVVPYMISNFRVSANRTNWGVAGFSSGGTCALDLTVMHPDMFSTFLDIGGDLSPNSGTKEQTINRLFGGNADAWAAFDPSTVITKHGQYSGVSGLFVYSGAPNPAASPEGKVANSLCALSTSHGIRCIAVAQPGHHDWPFAATAFAAALPWLAGQLSTPDVPRIPWPATGPAPEHPR